jgi:uncharacterized protein with von Willebrand factor type A (vWA) domain
MAQVINIDSLDREIYSDIKVKNERVSSWEREKKDDAFSDLLLDGFGSFFKHEPRLVDEVPPDRFLNARVMQQVQELAEYDHLRNYTTGDEIHSVGSLDVINQTFDGMPQQLKDKQKQLSEQQQNLDDMLGGDDFDPSSEEGQEELEQRLAEMQKTQAQLAEIYAEHEDEIRRTMRSALRDAEQQAEETEEACQAFGWGREGTEISQTPSTEKIRIAKLLKQNPQVAEMVKLAGRFIRIAEKKQEQKVDYERSEIEGITLGNNLPDVLPSEILRLADPDLEYTFFRDYAESALTEYELKGVERVGKGPVIVQIDCSGSMCGEPDIWSKAIALAMYSIARRQKRDFAIVLFNTVIVKELFLEKGEKDSENILKILTAGTGGGTEFVPPLGRAVDLIDSNQFNQADLVFITDGICDIPDGFKHEFDKLKKERQFAVFSVWIGSGYYWGGATSGEGVLNKFSDKVISLGGDIMGKQDEVFDLAFTV